MREWRRSGATAAEYARNAGVNAGTLSHWAWRLGREERAAARATKAGAPGTKQASGYIEVLAATSGRRRFEVALDNGRRVVVPEGFVSRH